MSASWGKIHDSCPPPSSGFIYIRACHSRVNERAKYPAFISVKAELRQEGKLMASSCFRGGLDWILGKITVLKEWSDIGIGCPGKWWSPHT